MRYYKLIKMLIGQILEPEESAKYILNKFKELAPDNCEELKNNDKEYKAFIEKMEKLVEGKEPDCHGFIDYLASKELEKHLNTLKVKPTKRKPLSYERLNFMVMPIFKYFETDKVSEKGQMPLIKASLTKWLDFLMGHKGVNLNAVFES